MELRLPGMGKRSALGLDIGSASVKALEISVKSRGKGFDLKGVGVSPMADEAIVQGAFLDSGAIVESIQEAVRATGSKTKDAVVAVSGHSVIVKKVSLPSMSREELEQQIQWEAEQYIPFDVNEVNLEFEILEDSGVEGQMEALLVAAKKDLIDDYMQVVGDAGLNLVAVDVASFALANAYEINYEVQPESVVALVNIGAQVVNINVLQGGVPSFTRDIATGGGQYTQEIQKALSVSYEEAERIKRGENLAAEGQEIVPQEVEHAMRSVTDALVGEITRSLDFFAATEAESQISKILLGGGGARVQGLARAFEEKSGLDVEILNPLSRMLPNEQFDTKFLDDLAPSLGVSIGLAARRGNL